MKNEMEPEMISTLIFNKLINVKELTRLKYYYTNMEQFENKNTFTSIKLPLKSKKNHRFLWWSYPCRIWP